MRVRAEMRHKNANKHSQDAIAIKRIDRVLSTVLSIFSHTFFAATRGTVKVTKTRETEKEREGNKKMRRKEGT